jgi:hypothetical protein
MRLAFTAHAVIQNLNSCGYKCMRLPRRYAPRIDKKGSPCNDNRCMLRVMCHVHALCAVRIV